MNSERKEDWNATQRPDGTWASDDAASGPEQATGALREYLVTLVNRRHGGRVQTGVVSWHRLHRILQAVRNRHGLKTTLSETGHFPLIVRTYRGGPIVLKIEDGTVHRSRLHAQANQLAAIFGGARR